MPPRRTFVRRCGHAACVCVMVASLGQRSLPGSPSFLPLLPEFVAAAAGTTLGSSIFNGVVKRKNSILPPILTKPDVSNPDLIALLETWQEGNRLFNHIYLYKTSLTSASGGKETYVPDYMGVTHHEGVVLKHASEGGQEQFLQLDFGSDGLKHALSRRLPDIPNQVPWGEGHSFKEAPIAPKHGHPKRLIRVLEMMEGESYHAFKWNCQSFADLMWRCFPPWNTAWVPDLWVIFEDVARKHHLLEEGKDGVSRVFNSSLQKVA